SRAEARDMAREEALYKDKIEVSLDGRQIFYLFFGGAVVVGLVFVLGVMVGRRVEARGHVERAQTQAAVDPLAALDRLDNGGGLSFQGALRGNGDAPTSDVEKQIGDLAAKKKSDKPAVVAAPAPAPVAAPAKAPEKAPEKPADKPVDKPAVAAAPTPPADPIVKPEPKKDDKPKGKFTLQLSSFQDKAEAEAYLANLKANGFSAPPFISEGDVDGKTYYRVRMGNYRTMEAANDAKGEVEKALKKTATVMKQ
ncbi:MAG: SPOR domain-containing protein, partial [Kofleriaceae bacterium]